MSVSSLFVSSQFNNWLRGGWLEDYQSDLILITPTPFYIY